MSSRYALKVEDRVSVNGNQYGYNTYAQPFRPPQQHNSAFVGGGPRHWDESEGSMEEKRSSHEDPSVPSVCSKCKLLQETECSRGPKHWCLNKENFKKCAPHLVDRQSSSICADFLACGETANKDGDVKPNPTPQSLCKKGPAHWCSSEEHFKTCAPSVLGSNRETSGICASYRACGETVHKDKEALSLPCAKGPDSWCSSDEYFNKCVNRLGKEGKTRQNSAICNSRLPPSSLVCGT